MDLTEDQQLIRDSVLKLCARFDDGYWLARDRDGEFPRDFVAAFAEGGWIGTAMPADYGGAGLGVTEFAPQGKAAEEIRGLWQWVLQRMTPGMFNYETTQVRAAG